jgi:DNA-binding response OmpR family regulator
MTGLRVHRARAVLVVEDDEDLREVVADAIESAGRLVFTAQDGADALQRLDQDGIPRPCLILLDWIMHPMSGEEFLARLKARGDADQLPVLVMSASTTAAASTITPGVLGVLPKPFGIEALRALIDEHC